MIDVVIPARNEWETIGNIVKRFADHPMIGSVFVMIDDDTTDDTQEVAEIMGAVTTRMSGITGKGQLLKWGLTQVETSRVIFSDADYVRMPRYAIDLLTSRMADGNMRVIVPRLPTQIAWKATEIGQRIPLDRGAWSWNSGLRSFPTHMAAGLDLHGYLTETQLNTAAREMHVYPEFLYCPSLVSPLRFGKQRMDEMERDRQWGLVNGVFNLGENLQDGKESSPNGESDPSPTQS